MSNNRYLTSTQRHELTESPYDSQHRHHRRHHHHHHHNNNNSQNRSVSSTLSNGSYSTPYYPPQPTPVLYTPLPPTPISTSTSCSAYFLYRVDVDDYKRHTLKHTVENVLSRTKSKGLKVKLSLPNEGLIIDNIPDPGQSWMFKTSELLYFWRDPLYSDIIVVITINRSRQNTNQPYSASIFRLRGTTSASAFIQRAQQFFSALPVSMSSTSVAKNGHTSKPTTSPSTRTPYRPIEKPTRVENWLADRNHPSNTNDSSTTIHRLVSKQRNIPNQSTSERPYAIVTSLSPQTAPIRLVTRSEFDPGNPTTNDTIGTLYDRRTYSDTASSESPKGNSINEPVSSFNKRNSSSNYDDDEKLTTVSNSLPGDAVAELMRELKELRMELAALKLEARIPPRDTRSMSTSPLTIFSGNKEQRCVGTISSTTTSSPSFADLTSQSEVDAETQTDFSLIGQTRRRQPSRKNKKTMIGSGGVPMANKKKIHQSIAVVPKRTLSDSSANTISDIEETIQEVRSISVENSSDASVPLTQERPVSFLPPRPILTTNENGFIHSNGSISMSNSDQITGYPTEENILARVAPIIEKEVQNLLSTNASSLLSAKPTETVSFRASLEGTSISPEHIYENVPIQIQTSLANHTSYYNIPIVTGDDDNQQQQQQQQEQEGYLYYSIANDRESEPYQQYITQVLQQQNGLSYLTVEPPTPPASTNSPPQDNVIPSQPPADPQRQIVATGRHRSQQIFFANHLTNPVFNVDKQLLANTIANQFGFDINSPQLQQLITNQHLFAARKRTFANMVWQLTTEEETALCSSPLSTTIGGSNMNTVDSNSPIARSILKANKRLRSVTKRRNITWDSSLE